MSTHSMIIAKIQLAPLYTFYKADYDAIRLKHVAVIPKQSCYYFHNKMLPLKLLICIIIVIITKHNGVSLTKMEAEQVNLLKGIKPDSIWISGHVKSLYLLQHKA